MRKRGSKLRVFSAHCTRIKSDNCDPEANPCPTLTKPTLAAGVDDEDCAAPDAAAKADTEYAIKKEKGAESTCYVQQDRPCAIATTITTEDDCKIASTYLHPDDPDYARIHCTAASLHCRPLPSSLKYAGHVHPKGCTLIISTGAPKGTFTFNSVQSPTQCGIRGGEGFECICKSQC